MKFPSRIAALFVLTLSLLAVGVPALAADAPAGAPTLRVAIAPIAPFVLPQSGEPQGFSIDIWNEVARRIRMDFVWRPYRTQTDLLSALQQGQVDAAISAIAMTPARERSVDFSVPYFDSGLQIMVRANNERSFLESLSTVPWLAIVQLVGLSALILFGLANLVWLVERKRDPAFQKPYLHAIGEGAWVTMLIIATGEYGERGTGGLWRRMLVPAMWVVGVILIAQLTATVTSSQTVARLQSSIRGPDDLPGKKIGTVPATVAAEYLTDRGLPYVDIRSADQGFQALMRGDIQAIVYDAPTLQYWAARFGSQSLAVVGPVFLPEKYGIAVATGNNLRKPINEALLAMYEDGTYERIYGKWFSRGK
ncbi:hypothetical protein BTH42_08245 [Burkholderia sp. SRS-W-2-2016]|uniref:transporter substrate-binding domain-containing protein n=1 Tax=Burkholderia sp. SRS-W-2-2016 TaxID=1926878 RepID=UPI00094AACE1|nr:transporter substrate-binding domain-containing protein [Burkholderia sp. SRS-W-2-2016]OLL32418.1 hypothetical protein BTH42_08245 [Burkholderia sp. SRS-W-2-2016]